MGAKILILTPSERETFSEQIDVKNFLIRVTVLEIESKERKNFSFSRKPLCKSTENRMWCNVVLCVRSITVTLKLSILSRLEIHNYAYGRKSKKLIFLENY